MRPAIRWIGKHLVGFTLFFVAFDAASLGYVLTQIHDPYRLPLAVAAAFATGAQVILAVTTYLKL